MARIADFTTGTYTGITPANVSASGGYAQTVAGVLVPFAANVLRRTDKGLLVEPTSTNKFKQSQTFDAGFWATDGGTGGYDGVVAPDGTTTADTITGTNNYPTFNSNLNPVSFSGDEIFSAYFKRSTAGKQPYVQFNNATGGGNLNASAQYWNIDTGLGAGTQDLAGTQPFTNATVKQVSDGFYRVSARLPRNGTNNEARVFLGFSDATGDRLSTIGSAGTWWGAQFETLTSDNLPSSYFPTTSAAATRSADAVSFTVPTGTTVLTFTFDDATTQTASVTAGATYTIPTNLNRRYIKYIDGNTAGTPYNVGITASAGSSAVVNEPASRLRAITASAPSAFTRPRSITVKRIINASTTPTMDRRFTRLRSIVFAAASSVSVITLKAKSVTVAAAVSSSASMSRAIGIGRTVSAGTSLTIRRAIARTSATVSASTIGITALRPISRTITAAAATSAFFSTLKARGVTVAVSVAASFTIRRAQGKSIAFVSATALSTAPAMTRRIMMTFTSATTVLLSYLRPSAAASTERILKIAAEDRTRIINAEDRTNTIPGEF